MKRKALSAAAVGLLAVGCVTPGDVQGALSRMGQRAVDDTADTAYDSARRAVTEGPGKKQPREAGDRESGPSAKDEDSSHEGSGKSGASAQSRASVQTGEVYANEFDFIPGDKVLFFEDFSDTAVGEYPVKWTRKDIGGGNGVEVVAEGGRHWLRIAKAQSGTSQDFLRSEFPDLPKKFTLEFDAYFDPGAVEISIVTDSAVLAAFGSWGIKAQSGTSAAYEERPGLKHVAMSVSDSYLKLYVDGARVLVDADGVQRPIRRLGISLHSERDSVPLLFTNVRLAEGGKDYRRELVSLGRIVTHGITFDTGSDALKPESGPTLRSILQLLQEEKKLRFEIQGHTDNQGGEKVNQPLSERRAQAVKTWLSKQGIAASRLTTRGFGSAKPLDSNETAEGRANNRRVEFVKAK
jgi:OOP family OmpA-OmpF porin